ncbi:hypothetical protein BDN70DRAFT_889199 [Pholiota conissans]|uniref:Uncharacterized protein n=1 Tax=Pholiota conissans TaxID=109636 RepID=A0A9P6CS49_9AGAR|nr:hypothetical protein BDN70DRAFT_889199 [Pholiota conissans]
MQTLSEVRAADVEYLVRQTMYTGYQWSSLIAPPAYIVYIIARKGRGDLSINKILRATWIGGFSGAAISGGGAYMGFPLDRLGILT